MLSLDDRIKSIRETKIRHTLEKREQNGCTDLDDFGTVPLPEGYEVMPHYTSENGSFYGCEGMAENFCCVLDAHPAYVDPMEMLCGRWRDMLVNYRGDVHYMPDWMKKNDKLRNFIVSGATEQWSKRWDEKRFPYDELKPLQKMYNISTGIDGDAHFACDYRIGFKLGFGGFLEKIAKYRAVNPGKDEFYASEEKCVLAMIRFIDRHIVEIRSLIETEKRPEIKANLLQMLNNCENIRTGAPNTFAEACQWAAFFNCFARVYTRDGAGFQLDTLLLPYYEADVASGRLDDDKTRFLLANLLLIDPHYYQISGVDQYDRDITNRLSYLVLEAADLINISCNLTVRVHDNCDPEFLRLAVGYLFKNKNGWPRFCCDRTLCEGYMRNGVDKATARERIAVGCNWMCVPGREFPMNDTVKINIAKVFEQALISLRTEATNGSQPILARLYELYLGHLAKAVKVTAAGVNLHLDHIADVTPELVMNLMFKDSLERGLDASRCAELYTVGCDGAGLAVVADSLAAIESRIEHEPVVTWEQLFAALDDNFADLRIHAAMKSAPRFCQGGTIADVWAKKLTDSFVSTVRSQKMPGGRMFIPGWFSWARSIEYGRAVGATPNGRRSGEPISHGANPNPGFRRDGAVTALSNGIASVQPGYGNTAPLQLEIDPKIGADEGGIDAICDFILGHFAAGGTLININILDVETLLEANRDPSTHPDLVVRVTGFTAYFSSLSPGFRQLVVSRFLEGF